LYGEVVILGIVVSILFSELTGLSPAGLVVAGYIVLCLQTPLRIVLTIVIALITVLLIRLADRFFILYGRRRFAATVLISFSLVGLMEHIPFIPILFIPLSISAIGYLVPGIIANVCDRQGIMKSLLSLGVVVAILTLLIMLAGYPVF
jgi:poly-gamma-glutamate biosynthesis protein PgsC/CapC